MTEANKKKKWWMLEKWGLSHLKLNLGFLEADFDPSDADRDAAWHLYVELLTRITTQKLEDGHGDEGAALASVFNLFRLTRKILKKHGSECNEFTKLAIPILNQVIRPFTAKWHGLSKAGAFENPEKCKEFRDELAAVQKNIRLYTKALADMAQVEDLTDLEKVKAEQAPQA